MNCNEHNGFSVLGGSKDDERFGDWPEKLHWNFISKKTEISIENREYVMIKCGGMIKQAFLINQFSESASNRAQKVKNDILSSLGL